MELIPNHYLQLLYLLYDKHLSPVDQVYRLLQIGEVLHHWQIGELQLREVEEWILLRKLRRWLNRSRIKLKIETVQWQVSVKVGKVEVVDIWI